MILNIGSLNIDIVFNVGGIVRPGETTAAHGMRRFAGGKGLNQSLALARAGAAVRHAGCVGPDGVWLRDLLQADGVDCRHILVDGATGSGTAFIQVGPDGENAIVISAGTNGCVAADAMATAFTGCGADDYLLVQNEVSDVPALIRLGRRQGMRVVFNPAPCSLAVRDYPLADVDLLIVNQTEAMQLSGSAEAQSGIDILLDTYPQMEIVLTLGADGAIYARGEKRCHVPALKVQAVDTTAAGDTFIGYLLASLAEGIPMPRGMELATVAAALAVSRPGAASSIPYRREVEAALVTKGRTE